MLWGQPPAVIRGIQSRWILYGLQTMQTGITIISLILYISCLAFSALIIAALVALIGRSTCTVHNLYNHVYMYMKLLIWLWVLAWSTPIHTVVYQSYWQLLSISATDHCGLILIPNVYRSAHAFSACEVEHKHHPAYACPLVLLNTVLYLHLYILYVVPLLVDQLYRVFSLERHTCRMENIGNE